MPRLTDPHYLRLHRQLHWIWIEHIQVLSWLSHKDQDLHEYFQLAVELPEHALLAHRRRVTAIHPALPQCAGRAYARLASAVLSEPPAHAKVKTFPTTGNRERRLYVTSVRRSVIDAERIARVVVAMAEAEARKLSTSRPTDEPPRHESGQSALPSSEQLPPPLPPEQTSDPKRKVQRSDLDPAE